MRLSFSTGSGPAPSRWRGWLSAVRLARALNLARKEAIALAIEAFVTAVEPRLRAIRHYDRRLWHPMAETFDYLDELVAHLPSAIDISRAAWQQNPVINAFFASPTDLSLVLARSVALQEFFQRHPLANETFSLLILTRQEKQVFGLSVMDDMLRRDVAQTRVTFVEPRLLYPAATEESTRLAARQCGVALFLAGLARERLTRMQRSQQSLEYERLMLQIRRKDLRARAQRGDRDGSLARGVYNTETRLLALDLERSGANLGHYNPLATMLDEASQLLANHRHQLRLDPITLRMDRLGIKHEPSSSAGVPVHDLSLLECVTEVARQIVILVRCTRSEFSGAALFLPDSGA